MNRLLHLDCPVCGVNCDIEGYDPAPTELLIGAFSEAHFHTEEERAEWRKAEAAEFKEWSNDE